MNDYVNLFNSWNKAMLAQLTAAAYFAEGAKNYHADFLKPLLTATSIFQELEAARAYSRNPLKNKEAYAKLGQFNNELLNRYTQGSLKLYGHFFKKNFERYAEALNATLFEKDGEKIDDFFIDQQNTLHRVVIEYPQAIKEIEPEFGFHFENTPESCFAETERFFLHKVAPSEPGVKTDESLKPVIIIPPFVLGANILAFLPMEKKSYAHSFANRSIPTYIRTMKDIQQTPAVQTMTLEDDLRDTVSFCEKVKKKHDQPVTLNGYCQGGFSALANILTGKLDGLVDAFITCVAP
jgi:hypothetical protein